MNTDLPTVLVVDDDASVLNALRRLIRSAGLRVLTFARPSELLASEIPGANACVILDVNFPEMNGVQLHEALIASGRDLPAIMITGRSDARTQCLLRGARPAAILYKPFGEDLLLDAISREIGTPDVG